jgi:succinate dehydrogenase hydrophobic anchor subunit
MIAQHFVAAGGIRSFQDVLAYIRNPLIIVLELAFLAVVTYHALLGVRAIVADLGLTRRQESTINRILTVLGVVMVAWGGYLTWHLVARAA